jgi:hypothetical protein
VSSFRKRRRKRNFDLWFVQNPNSVGRGARRREEELLLLWGGGGVEGEGEKWLLGSLLQMGTLWWRE